MKQIANPVKFMLTGREVVVGKVVAHLYSTLIVKRN